MRINKNATVIVEGDTVMNSAKNAVIRKASVSVSGNLTITAEKDAKVANHALVTVSGDMILSTEIAARLI